MSWLRRDQQADGQQAVAPAAPAAPTAPSGSGAPAAPPVATAAPVSQPLLTIDALGRKCPIPIIMLAARIVEVPVGSVIAVLADDPAAYTDVPAWCGLKSHDCVFRTDLRVGGWAFGVRRRY